MTSVMLYSGGMDSLIMSHVFNVDVCLYVDVGGQYSAKEIQSCGDYKKLKIKKLDIGEYELKDSLILPNRNAYFCLLASHYGETIYLGATDGDRSTDKDEGFIERMESLLNHMNKPQHWTKGKTYKVLTPFMDQTKTEMVRLYLDTGGSIPKLLNSISCYNPYVKQCGICKPCARKWVALKNNGLGMEASKIFPIDPSMYFTDDILKQCELGLYRGPKEDADILKAMGRN